MLARARTNASKSPYASRVSFVEANIISIPLPAGIADCVISNCVVNLVPEGDKPAVFLEMARLLKSGGQVAMSDILARKTMPEDLKSSIALLVGCVAGASEVSFYRKWLEEAGFGGEYK